MHKKENSMGFRTTLALIIIIAILGFGGTMWYYALYKVAYTQYFDVQIETGEYKTIGFNADASLHFGKVPKSGGTAMKEMVLKNDLAFPVLVQINVNGAAAQFIQLEDNNFLLQPDELRKLKAYAVIPAGFEQLGNYTGEAKVTYFRI